MGRLDSALPTDPDAPPRQDALRARSLEPTLPLAITPHLTLWRLLGEGGASRVYEAHDRRLARRVAVKLLGAREGYNSTARERLLREAELYARIEDPRTPGVYEVSSLGDGTPYVVMEYVVGQSLAELIRHEPLGVALACEIAAEILSALCSVHRHGVVHRDVKPSNILLEQAEEGRLRARLVDFGIAKASSFSDMQLTQPGSLLGTPQYMAPEQLAGLEVDARADLYATGLVFYEMLLGTGPHRKNSIGDLVAARMRDDLDLAPLARAGIPNALSEFLRRALARNPDARFGSAEEMLCELHAARAEQNCVWVSAPSTGTSRPASRARGPEDASHPARAALDASGLHPFAEEDFATDRPRRRSRAVHGLLLGFGLTFATGVWILQPQLSSGLRSDESVKLSGSVAPATSETSARLPAPELAAKPAAAATPEAVPENLPSAANVAAAAPARDVAVSALKREGPAATSVQESVRAQLEQRRGARNRRVQDERVPLRSLEPRFEVRTTPTFQSADGVPPNPY
jgi:serine/threonine-protein kinase